MTARLLEPVPFTDPALRQGEVIADHAIGAIRNGASDPDLLMRTLLRVVADAGYMVAPTSLMRGVCARLQREISGGGRDAAE